VPSLDDAIIIRYKTHGHTFELFADPDEALAFREGERALVIAEILAVETVFKDASAGDKASEDVIQSVFGTTEPTKVFEAILTRGELHLTTEQRRKMLADRRRQVAAQIARNAVNPQTGKPHPLQRIERAMDEARVDISLHQSVNEQVQTTLKALRPCCRSSSST